MRRKIFILTVLIIILTFTLSANAIEIRPLKNDVSSDIPESWYEAPKLSSELGITQFEQSPILKEEVEEGNLPPVEQRLPKDPPVIEPFEKVGEYGGTLNSWGTSLGGIHGAVLDGVGSVLSDGEPAYATATPDVIGGTNPYMVKGWDASDDKKTWTFYLREGVKWSDGEPFTAEDFMYWWKYVANNEDLNPVSPENWDISIVDVERIDDYTVKFHFGRSQPELEMQLNQYFEYGLDHPAHYLKQYHISFRDEEELLDEAKDAGYDTWYEYYEYMDTPVFPERGGIRPTLLPYVFYERSTTHIKGRRNPYFPFVDTEGNQLPYIDYVRVDLAADLETVTMKTIEGQSDLSIRFAFIKDLAVYQKNQEAGGYDLLRWYDASSSDVTIMTNQDHLDPELNELFRNKHFRQALSVAIDREEINERVYYGMGTPMQISLPPDSKYFTDSPKLAKEIASAFAEHDPEKSRALLDEIGMVDVNDDGWRETPEGNKFNPELIYTETSWCPAEQVLELVQSHFHEVGLNVQLKYTELWSEITSTDEWDMSFNKGFHTTDQGFVVQNNRFLPTPFGWVHESPWVNYVRWWQSNGMEGKEPPQELKEIADIARDLRHDLDEGRRLEAGRELLKLHAENIWTIGTVGRVPRPVIKAKNLKNIPSIGLWSDDSQYLDPFYPVQFYFEGE